MPILHSGTFVLYAFELVDHGGLLNGDTEYGGDPAPAGMWSWQNFNTSSHVSFPTDVTFTGPALLDTSADGLAWPATSPPPGFTIHVGGINGPSLVDVILTGCVGSGGLVGETSGAGLFSQCGSTSYQNTDAFLAYLALLDPYRLHLTATVGLTSGGIFKTGPWSSASAGPRITGGYDIIAWWWLLPEKDACGNPQDSQLALSPDRPAPGYAQLDPTDPDAHPTPTIDAIDPSHGPIVGGTAITLTGSGFGQDATVTFDGVAATSVVVVTQHRITCVAPAHAAGSTDVVVTNADGVSS